MASIQEVKTQIENANVLGRQNLTEKGVTVPDNATTYEIMQCIADISSGGGGTEEWYDFTITVTSEATNGQQLLDVFSPYLGDLRGGKDIAFVTLLNANVVADDSGTAIQCLVTRIATTNALTGKMLRYRRDNNIVYNIADMTDGYGITPFAGAVYYVKVVQVIA